MNSNKVKKISQEEVEAFCNTCSHIHNVWAIHKTIFDNNPKKDELFADFCYFMLTLNEVTLRYSLLEIGKLFDPAKDPSKKDTYNLSIQYFVDYGEWGNKKAEILEISRKLKEFGEYIKNVRNKLLAHNDIDAITSNNIFGDFPEDAETEFFRNLEGFASEIYDKWIGGPYIIVDDRIVQSDAESFLSLIEESISRKKEHQKKQIEMTCVRKSTPKGK